MSSQKKELALWYATEIQPHESLLRAWLCSRFSLNESVDDIIQEVFVRAVKAHEKGILYAPKAFLFKAARNLAIDHLRKKSHNRSEPLANLESSNVIYLSDSIPEMVSRNQEYAILNQAIASLPEKCREIFTMRRIYGMSQAEISEALGVSPNTVSAQLTIGLRKCGEFFARYDVEGGEINAAK
ncbi:MAG: sigma-70 family RNA polymerase sigma factor [Verrucomicrobiae bacterium]|nr:sigma-70 family RNA polymerase sigma factor [Verrucomicrobiae bacterium]